MISMDAKEKSSPRSLMQFCILISSLLMVNVQSKEVDVYRIETFTVKSTEESFSHMAVRTNGDVYISSQKSLYRLSDSLALIHRNETCSLEDCVNINKVLVIDYENSRLITCGGGNNGRCESRSLDELTYNAGDTAEKVVSYNDLSAIGYIAEKDGENYLYVAATDDGAMSSTFNTISIRLLTDFRLLSGNGFQINDAFKNKIQYVAGFSYQKFRYFIANINEVNGEVPRMSRICNTATIIDNLSDVYLRCDAGTNSYKTIKAVSLGPAGPDLAASLGLNPEDYVLYAVFTLNSTSTNSALCIYKWSDIEVAFEDAMYGCAAIDGETYKLNYAGPHSCPGSINIERSNIGNYICEGSSSWTYSQGAKEEAASSQAVLVLPNHNLTAITTVVENNHTIAFLGTADGHLLKAHLVNNTAARMFEDVTLVEGSMLRSDLVVSVDNMTLLALTAKQLQKLRVENCTQYTTCDECIGPNAGDDGDPYCGWCTLESKCSRLSECFSNAWIPSGSDECIAILGTAPEFLSITAWNIKISVSISQLPSDQTYTCKLDGIAVETESITTGSVTTGVDLVCGPITQAPILHEGEVAIYSSLSIYSNLTGVDIVSTDFAFYNCTAITSCLECVNSFACDWCPLGNTCTYLDSTPCQDNDVAVKNDTTCPQLVTPRERQLVHSGKTKEIMIEARHLPEVTSYICVIDGNESKPVQATRITDTSIICDSTMYEYADEVQEKNVTLRVAWNNTNYIDNQFIVTLYKCSVDQPDCSTCLSSLSTPPEYNCTWCNTGECVYGSDCAEVSSTCPAPVVQEIVPSVVATSSDIEYVDEIQLIGTNLWKYVDEVEIDVGGKSCKIINETYVVGRSVSCLAPAFAATGKQLVTLTADGVSTTSQISLIYQKPELLLVRPTAGIMAGGTPITIVGLNLNFDSVSVSINTSVCNITSKSESQIDCMTGPHEMDGCWVVTVTFGMVKQQVGEYCYQTNPKIYDYSPKKSIQSGGRVITVNGSNFQYVQDAKMRVKGSYETNCTSKTESSMSCDSPIVEISSSRRRRQATDRGVDFSVTFILDGLDLDTEGLRYYPDPFYYSFKNESIYEGRVDNGIYQFKDGDTHMFLIGLDLTLASDKDDVSVFVGDTELIVVEITMTHVKVELPNYELDGTTLTLKHNNIEVIIGGVQYPPFDFVVMLIIICILFVFIVIITLVAARYLYKSRMIKNQVKNIRLEMEELEKTVKDEARQAIADLALGLTDLTDDLKGVGMPFLSHRDYACSMLFTGFEIVPDSVEIDERDEDRTKNSALLKFSKLLMDKQFLLAFIRMINNNNQITIREKGNFASLLTVAMIVENKLEYMTEILEVLLKEYIEDHMYSKKARQVLIRNETVIERLLSNWIALSMYNYLKYHAAFPLYLLFQAIKSLIQMGPVDAVTNYSTHSLSIDHVLPSGIDVEVISLVVVLNDEDGEQIEVKVLTCDSVSQVKMKLLDAMYKNRPYSVRPKIEELHLEWRNGRNGHLVLQDRDDNSLRSGNWQKINTLNDFGVTDRSVVALITKQNVANVGIQVDLVSPTSTNYSKTQGYQNVVLMTSDIQLDFKLEEGISYYHLVKDDDVDPRDRSQVPREFKRGQTIQYKRKKIIKEIHFPRLVSTKETIQEYVDDMFNAIVKTPSETHKVPLAIKFLFDLFDEEGGKHEVDSSILKTWKNNSFLARFWVQVITHPNFIFDIAHLRPVEVALDIISRTFLDSCSAVKIKFTKESPVNRLLYTKEIESYRRLVDNFYSSVHDMPDFNRSELIEELDKACQNFSGLFSKSSTLFHLHSYAEEHKTKLLKALKEVDADNKMADLLKEISDVMKMPAAKNGHMQ